MTLLSSFAIASSFVEAAGQHALDSVNLRCDVARGETGDLADRRRVRALEVKKDHLAVERLEELDERVKAIERRVPVALARDGQCDIIDADEGPRLQSAITDDMCCPDVVCDAIDPRAQGAVMLKMFEASPHRE